MKYIVKISDLAKGIIENSVGCFKSTSLTINIVNENGKTSPAVFRLSFAANDHKKAIETGEKLAQLLTSGVLKESDFKNKTMSYKSHYLCSMLIQD